MSEPITTRGFFVAFMLGMGTAALASYMLPMSMPLKAITAGISAAVVFLLVMLFTRKSEAASSPRRPQA